MSIFDDVLKNLTAAPDDVRNLAHQIGIDPGMAEKAIAALGKSHQEEGDTIDLAAAKTGLDAGVLNQIRDAIGGEGSLGEFARMIDQDGDGNPLDEILGMAKGLFGKG